jgi:hypothetical protein
VQEESDTPTLVVVNGVMAFYEQDCAGGLDPLLWPDQSPPVCMGLMDVHTRIITGISELAEKAAVVLLVVDAAVQMDDVAGIICRDPLPPAWQVCLALHVFSRTSSWNADVDSEYAHSDMCKLMPVE